jgi:hypothetical protein
LLGPSAEFEQTELRSERTVPLHRCHQATRRRAGDIREKR